MDIAVIADIHSNYTALKRCMKHALKRGITTFIFLGDYIGEMAYPERTMELLYEYRKKYNCYFVRGNKEDYWLDYHKSGETGWLRYNSTTGALWYAYYCLTARDLDFFESLPIRMDIAFDGLPTLTACHGSPRNTREQLIIDKQLTAEISDASVTDYILCGHTHRQNKICRNGRTILNPGSAGLPLYRNGCCQYMILHGENHAWTEEFITLRYDTQPVIDQLSESGLADYAPHWCMVTADLLRIGPNRSYGHSDVLERAMELCFQETGACNWPHIPEKYWEEAVNSLLPNV